MLMTVVTAVTETDRDSLTGMKQASESLNNSVNQDGCSVLQRFRVHLHQESLLIHLLWSGQNTMLIYFFIFLGVRFYTAPFCK